MASEDRQNLGGEPERRFARLIIEKRSLQPPVPIEQIVQDYAAIETATFPGSWDSLLLQPAGKRPTVLLAHRLLNTNRRRFTLAHELGHLLLPWQLGAMFCHTQVAYRIDDELIAELEAEANRFAAALLVPESWLRARLAEPRSTLAQRILLIASDAEVSPIVVLLSAGRVCPPATALFILDSNGRVVHRVRSQGTLFGLPDPSDVLALERLERSGATVSTCDYADGSICAVQFSVDEVVAPQPARDASALLEHVLTNVRLSAAKVRELRMSVAGVVGYATGSVKSSRSPATLLHALRQRFASRPDLTAVTEQAEFDEFLLARAHELAAPSQPKGSKRRADKTLANKADEADNPSTSQLRSRSLRRR